MRGGILWEEHYKRGSTVVIFTMITVNGNINTILNFSKIVFLWMNLKKKTSFVVVKMYHMN